MTQEAYNSLVAQSQPHKVFKKDWDTFYSYDFGDTFLPDTKAYNGEAVRTYDGANLFEGLKLADRTLLALDNKDELINIIGYTFPEDAELTQKIDSVKAATHEICWFAKVTQNDVVEVSLTYGDAFRDFVEDLPVTNRPFKTTISDFKEYFNNTMTHDQLMRYILKSLGIEEEGLANANYNKLFTPNIVKYLNNFKVDNRFNVEVFIKTTQEEVLKETGQIRDDEVEIFVPEPNDIFIWLVSKDYINYQSFAEIRVGENVFRALKQNLTDLEDFKTLIIQQLEQIDVNDQDIEQQTIDNALKKGLAFSSVRVLAEDTRRENPTANELWEKSPGLFITYETAKYFASDLEKRKFKPHQYNPLVKPFTPAFPLDTESNAIICGLINGVFDEVIALPETAVFFSEIIGSKAKKEEFLDGIKALFKDEELIKSLIENALQGYEDAFKEGNIEMLYYQLAHDAIQIVSLLIGVFQFAKGVSSFVNFTRKGLLYLRRYGKKGIKDLDIFNNKEIGEIFDELEVANSINAKKTAQFKQFLKKWDGKSIVKLSSKEIVENLKGFTEQANRIAKLIDDGEMIIKILDDTEFEELLIKYGDSLEEAKSTLAFNIEERNYFRASKPVDEFMSEIVHEGTHTLDHINGFTGDVYQIEKRAFFHERAFQKAVNINIDFDKIEDLLEFIYINY